MFWNEWTIHIWFILVQSNNFYRPMFVVPAMDRWDCFLNIMLVCVCVSQYPATNRRTVQKRHYYSEIHSLVILSLLLFRNSELPSIWLWNWVLYDGKKWNFRSYVHRRNWDSTTVSGQLRCVLFQEALALGFII